MPAVHLTSWLCQSPTLKLPQNDRRNCFSVQARQRLVACSACKPVTNLPNGLEVCYASKHDVSFLYREIFEEQLYLQHGIQLAQGDTVVDIGGNIGFFAIFAAQLVGPSGKVVTAEPIPTLYEKLLFNIRSHQTWCTAQGQPVTLIPSSHQNIACAVPGNRLYQAVPAMHNADFNDLQCAPSAKLNQVLCCDGLLCMHVGISAGGIIPVLMGVGSGQEQTMEFTFYTAAAGREVLPCTHLRACRPSTLHPYSLFAYASILTSHTVPSNTMQHIWSNTNACNSALG